MPIYSYKCDSCGFAKDVLQKLSDVPLSQCPSCGVASFMKQVTSAGFLLKGSGWYATDFKGGNNVAPAAGEDKSATSGEPKTDGNKDAKSEPKSEPKVETKPADSAAVKKPAAAPAAGSGT